MLKTPKITDLQIEQFRRVTYVVIPAGFDAEDAAKIERWTTEISEWPEESGRHWVYHETSLKGDGTRLINRIENMTPFHEGFAELAEKLRIAVGELLGEEAVLFKDKINFKMPGGDGFKPHQDLQAGWERYASYYVSALVCIDEATVENGCLELAEVDPNSHLGNDWEPLTEEQTTGLNFRPVPTKPGDLVFFDSFTPHASAPNMTDKPRRMYYGTYNKLSEGYHLTAYYADKYLSFPPDIERDPGKEYVFRV